MVVRPLILLSLLPWVIGVAAAAQDRAEDEIVVTSARNAAVDDAVVARQARQVSSEDSLSDTPLATFADPLCPGVIGLRQDAAETVVGRIRQIAAELGIPQRAAGSCAANVIVAFTADGRADIARADGKGGLLGQVMDRKERARLLAETGPAYVVSLVETRMQNGTPVPRKQELSDPPVGRMNGGHSRIYKGIRRDIVNVTVLFDAPRVRDLTPVQLADYAAMRVLARTREVKDVQGPDSILTLFDPANASPPQGLTAFDRAYLATLYASSPHTSGRGNLQKVAATLRKQAAGQ